MDLQGHPLFRELASLGIIDPVAVQRYYPNVRDRKDVGVLRCDRSGVIFLDRTDHVSTSYYAEQEGLSYWSKEGRAEGLRATREDDDRRARMIAPLVEGKIFADVGTGLGGILDLVRDHAREVHAVEPQSAARAMLSSLGYRAHASAAELGDSGVRCDLITMFHVFEHLTEPLAELKRIKAALAPGGEVIIEVPHAKDILLGLYNVEAFKAFTLWSEHLILHTRSSLRSYLEAAGFEKINIVGVQRYPLANHLYWLRHGLPGGQNNWPQLNDEVTASAYARLLDSLDATDTLVATAATQK
jgi:2-polyprenyl-3-methyl-5-hydroxy-6-metoxy-1,4-benzoquinol methylase